MKVKIYLSEKHDFAKLGYEIMGSLIYTNNFSVEIKKYCLGLEDLLENTEVVISHPCNDEGEINNESICYLRIKNIIKQKPEIQFYILALNISEREGNIGEYKNIIYINYNHQREFCSDAAKYILEHQMKKT